LVVHWCVPCEYRMSGVVSVLIPGMARTFDR
jgi:hypothetical protein